MFSNWKAPLLLFTLVSLSLYLSIFYLTQEAEEPFKQFTIPGRDRSFVFIISANNAENHCIKTLTSILEQSYQNFQIYYIDDGSKDNTYKIAKEFVDQYYPNAPVHFLKNEKEKGALFNAYERIQHLDNYKVVALLDGNCYLPTKDILKDFNNLYKVEKVWLSYGQNYNITKNKIGGCRRPPNLSFFPSMRNRYWKRPYLKTFYAGLFQKVKLEDFFFQGKFVGEEYDASYMFPMLELAGKNVGFLKQPVCHYIEKEEKPRTCITGLKEWICRTDPYSPLEKPPGAVSKKIYKNRSADLIIFSYDRPLQLYALIESIQTYMSGVNSISVIFRASNKQYIEAYENVGSHFNTVRFIKQSDWPEHDFKSLAIQTTFQKCIDASQYVIYSADDIIVKSPINVSDCIQTLKNTGAYCFAFKERYKSNLSSDPDSLQSVKVNQEAIGWQINESRGDWDLATCITMTLYRKIDLHNPFFSIKFKHTLDLAKNWAQETKPYLREKRERVGICFIDPKVVNIPINQSANNEKNYTPETLLHMYNQGLKFDISSVTTHKKNSLPTFVSRELFNLRDSEDTGKLLLF
jgi:glycosyltransferase involved in cell wall biosynthesis